MADVVADIVADAMMDLVTDAGGGLTRAMAGFFVIMTDNLKTAA